MAYFEDIHSFKIVRLKPLDYMNPARIIPRKRIADSNGSEGIY